MNHSLFNIKNIYIHTIVCFLLSNFINAQLSKGDYINASIGYGIGVPGDKTSITGNGFYAQGEYVHSISRWFSVRPYAGIILVSGNNDNSQQYQYDYHVTTKALLLGGKVRISAPIPYVAPYFEIGLGASIGSFETYTPLTDIKKSGIISHIPISLGLALGRNHKFDFAFTYYSHQSVKQFSGAAAIGFSFPL